MKAIIFILSLYLLVTACGNTTDSGSTAIQAKAEDSTNFTSIEWVETDKNYGKINEGEKLEVSFTFKNTGNKPLVIGLVKPSCGCTLVEKPEKPVPPGETGEIKGAFNSEGKPGTQHKSIFLTANTLGARMHNLTFQVEVTKKPS